jgi:hypothetical protein
VTLAFDYLNLLLKNERTVLQDFKIVGCEVFAISLKVVKAEF